MKLRTKITIVILVLFTIIGNIQYWNYNLVEGQPFLIDTGSKCGKVIDNFTSIVNIKYGTKTDYFLKVDYGDHIETNNVTAMTYHDYNKIGSTICIGTHKPISFYLWLVLTIDFILMFVIIILIIMWLFGYDLKKLF